MSDSLTDSLVGFYLSFTQFIGGLTGLVVFIGTWWYAAATYGFLFGFGLGWLPAGILAAITLIIVGIFWPLIALGVFYLYIST